MPIKLKKKQPGVSAYSTATSAGAESKSKAAQDADDQKRYAYAAEKYAAQNTKSGKSTVIEGMQNKEAMKKVKDAKGETVENIQSSYRQNNDKDKLAEKTNGGPANIHKTRKKQTEALKSKQIAKPSYGRGTSGIKLKKKGC